MKYFIKSYKNRSIALATGFLLLSFLFYKVSISRTIALRGEVQNKRLKERKAESAPFKLIELEETYQKVQLTNISEYDREKLLEIITSFAEENGVLLKNFPQGKIYKTEVAPVVLTEIILEGEYEKIVKLAYLIEYQERLSNISSLRFFKVKDRKNKKEVLRAEFILQNVQDSYS